MDGCGVAPEMEERDEGPDFGKTRPGSDLGVQGARTPGEYIQVIYFGMMTQSFLFLVSLKIKFPR